MTYCLPDVNCSGVSIAGPVRDDNQDSIYLHESKYGFERGQLFAIADGMGGYSLGNIASKMAIDAVANALFSADKANPGAMKSGIDRANMQIYNAAIKNNVGRMGTTLTIAFILGDTLHIGHVGDSRAYLVRDGKATCLTTDHTQVGEMVRAKLLTPDRIRTHANRSILTRAVGIDLFIKPDISTQKLMDGDRIILCSDGVWSVIEDHEFGTETKDIPIEETSESLINLALSRETDDNASVVAFQINALNKVGNAASIDKPNWLLKLRNITR